MNNFHVTIIILSLTSLLIGCGTESTPVYTLTTSVVGEGSISPSGGTYEEGETVTLTSNPSEHWIFNNWSGDGSGNSSTLTITMDRDKNVVGNFVEREYTINYTIHGNGSVDETVIQPKGEYTFGTVVQLTPVPETGWRFTEWNNWDGEVDEENRIVVTVDEETNIALTFERKMFPLTITIEGEGEVEQEIISTAKTTDYAFETVVQLTAKPDDGWRFEEWSGEIETNENPVILDVDRDIDIKGHFTQLVLNEVYPLSQSNVGFHSVRLAGSGRIYASTSEILINDNEDGIWLSEDNGSTWSKTHNTGAVFITGATDDPDLVIAGLTDGGYVISQDGGKSWSSGHINDPFGNSITFTDASAVNKNSPIYLSTRHATRSGVFRSNNLGNSWQYIFSNSDAINTFGSLIEQIEVVSSNPNILYARTGFAHDIIKSTDGGSSFISIKNGLPANITSLGAMRVNPDNGNQLFILNNISGNGGSSWSQQSISPNNYFWYNGYLMQATSNSIRKSDNLGSSWQTIVNFGQELEGVSGTPTIEMASESIFLIYNGVPRYRISLDMLKN